MIALSLERDVHAVFGGAVTGADVIGWTSSLILLATIMRQTYTQWKTKATAGVSKWLFVGQLAASTGYTIYSYLLHNWVFLTSNVALLATAVVGQFLYMRNRRRAKSAAGAPPSS